MRALPEAMRPNRLHQRRKHIPAIPRRLLQIPEPVTIMRLDLDHLIGIRHMPKRGQRLRYPHDFVSEISELRQIGL